MLGRSMGIRGKGNRMRPHNDVHGLLFDYASVEEEVARLGSGRGTESFEALRRKLLAFKGFFERWSHWLEADPSTLVSLAYAQPEDCPVRHAVLDWEESGGAPAGAWFRRLNPEPTEP